MKLADTPWGASAMIRKLLFPALLAGLLGGCVTAGYGYRDGYYYGQPSVEYRYYGNGYPYGYYPGYYGYGSGYYPYGERYRYYNGYPYYGYPYSGRGYYNPYYRQPRPSGGTPHGDNDRHLPPWRDLNRTRQDESTRQPWQTQAPQPASPMPRRESRSEGSPMRQVMQRAQQARRRESGERQEP